MAAPMTDAWRTVGEVVADLEQRAERSGEWQVSPWPGELFAISSGEGQVTYWSTRGVAVHAASSEFVDGDSGLTRRQIRGALRATSRVAVRWLYAMTIDEGTASYRAALDAEAALITDLLTPPEDGSPVRVLVDSATRAVLQEGWLSGEIRLSVTHHMPLTR